MGLAATAQPTVLRAATAPAAGLATHRMPMQPAVPQARPMTQPPAPRVMPDPALVEPEIVVATPGPVMTDAVSEETAYVPRQIPPHLRQPLRPQPQPAKPQPSGRNGGLFAEPSRAEPPPPPRRSLFGIMTGAFRGHAQASAAQAGDEPAARAEPALYEAPEPMRPSVRQAVSDDIGIDIPAFLRRQTS
jgi:cell division protein FtsZ